MEQQKIFNYIDNLDVNTQADLLKKILSAWYHGNFEFDDFIEEMEFFTQQIEEFNENYTNTNQELKQFDN